ncbi:hypothetical protein D7Z26_03535 [Cohnella endophytica]|uniref:Nucleotidyltransferase family protein n=1 Tax=Cohnella endophytica TaxID=2419778 RepID=A0A494Y327_9BACL|nr:hypothetical protein [Cohnella endophytica]RKP57069.1 hypothetical protein D7Z26_03535 [Cohnella endophytica]
MSGDVPESAISRVAELLEGCDASWVVGGSTGLALRGAKLERAPRDIDIYADQKDIRLIHDRLRAFTIDGPKSDRTERYDSILSHYQIEDASIEVVGDFRVTALDSVYQTEVADFLFPNRDRAQVNGRDIPIVPLGHELIFNLLRERKDRALIAGGLIIERTERHLPLLNDLLRKNRISAAVAAEAIAIATQATGRGGHE